MSGAGAGRRFCLVTARFNRMVTERLAEGARRALRDAGVGEQEIDVWWVPGAWELPWGARRAARDGYDGVVALGCVIRGETDHFDYICQAATRGLAELAAEGETPVGFGVLTCDTLEQGLNRAGGKHGNKGAEAAEAALEMLDLARRTG